MKETKRSLRKWNRLDTISFRGDKKIWLKFLSLVREKGKKSTWDVLGKLISNYVKREENK